ncbi:MAG: hypothetical protein CSA96_01770 [Bacteroidetes bacterium]|nr:MAG: hypothetical protein CSA96_01770 [Bacteroidota bacterium]
MKYGTRCYKISYPAASVNLAHREPEKKADPERFRQAILDELATRPVPKNAGIVVADKTRRCDYPVYLPQLIEALLIKGVARENISFYIAYGTHPKQSEKECIQSYGQVYRDFNFVHHDARDASKLTRLGKTSRGTDLEINAAVLEHELLITFGALSHHYFAGFGGGRKLMVPGLAGYETILKNHSLFLDFERHVLEEGCQSGNIETNPLALDLEEIAGMLPPRIEIHGLLNSDKELCEFSIGHNYADFKQACKRYDEFFRSDCRENFDMVVASAGGYPKDINFIQTHKTIHNAASFLKDGGRLVIFAECRDGIGNKAFLELFGLGGPDAIYEKMALGYRNNAGTALATLQKSSRFDIRFVTSLSEEDCALLGTRKTSPEEAIDLIRQEKGRLGRIENGSIIYR